MPYSEPVSTQSSIESNSSRSICQESTNKASSIDNCSQVTYIIAIPMIIMLLLNAIAFTIVVIFVIKKRDRKKNR